MPKVTQYQPDQVTTQVVKQPLAPSAPAGAFDTPIAKGAFDIAQSAAAFKQRIDTTSAEEALVQFERDKNDLFFNPESGYFNSQGRNAYDNSNAAVKALNDLKKKYSETLGQQSKFMFDNAADKHITRGQLDIARHASKGLKAWEISTLESQVENTIENASLYWDDPDRLKVQNVLGRQAIFDSAKMMGLGFEATAEKVQTYESAFAKSTIEAATQSNAVDGQEALKEYGDRLEGPDKVKMESLIEKKAKVEKTQADAIISVATATKLVSQYDDRKDIVEEVNKIKDDELRKKTMTESMSQLSRKKQAESEFRASSYEDAEDHLIKGGSAESFKATSEGSKQWESLSEKQKRNIESGVVGATDWNVFSDLMLLPKKELAKVDPTDHFDKLAKTERSRLISAVKSAGGTGSAKDASQVGRTRLTQTNDAVTQLFGKKKTWGKSKREQVNSFYSLLDNEVQFREEEKGSKLTSEEYTNVLSSFTRTVVQEGRIWDTELDLTDVPADDIPVLSKFLRDNNVPVTADNLIKAFKQASK